MKRRNVSETEDVLGEVNEFVEFCKRVEELQSEYESTLEPDLLDEMKAIKPKLQKAIFNYSKLVAVLVPRDSALPEEKILPKLLLINGYNILGKLIVYLKEYMEAWDLFEKNKQLGLKLQDEKGIAQSTKATGLVASALFDSTNNLGIVALKQEDYSIN